MCMTKVLCGVAALPLLFGVALAETPKQSNDSKASAKPAIQLSEQQMDRVSAGFKFLEVDVFNTGTSTVSVYNVPNTIACTGCYLSISNFAVSVASKIGPGGTPVGP
jgi:hypothetical protein